MSLRINQSDVSTNTPSASDLTPIAPHSSAHETGRLGLMIVIFGAVALVGAIAALVLVRA